jgi:D-3-phosphoglycerate dehydrogenase
MATGQTVIAIGHRFPNFEPEEGVFGPLGIRIVDGNKLSEAELEAELAEADGILVGEGGRVDAARVATLKRCRVIARYGTGLDNVAVDAAKARGIAVRNVVDYCTEEVANHALAMLLALHRGFPAFDRRIREGIWNLDPIAQTPRLSGLVLGIVGGGRIGHALGTRAEALGLRVSVYDPYVAELPAGWRRAERLADLLGEADFVSLHLPLSEATRHVLSRQEFGQMKRGAFLINVARGGLVDSEALVEALESGQIAGAGLDVFEEEPLPASHPLCRRHDVILTPHAAWYSVHARQDLQRLAAMAAAEVLKEA